MHRMLVTAAAVLHLSHEGIASAAEPESTVVPLSAGTRVVIVGHFVQWWPEQLGGPPPAGLANDSLATLETALRDEGLDVVRYSEYERVIARLSPECSSESLHRPHILEPDGASMLFMGGPRPERCLGHFRRAARRLDAEYIVLSGVDFEWCGGRSGTACIQMLTVDLDPVDSKRPKFDPPIEYYWSPTPGSLETDLEPMTPLDQYRTILSTVIRRGY